MDIVAALNHPDLFGGLFPEPSWTRWRAFLAALFGLPMSDAALANYREHTGRTAPPAEPFKEAAVICGRRSGKSRVLALVATYLATFRDYGPFLAPGEVATVAVIAADRKQARTIFQYIVGLLRGVPALAALIVDEFQETVALSNRVRIEIHTASFRVTRGFTLAAVLADETAFWWTDETTARPDVEIFRALRPGLATIPGAMLLNASSPYRKAGVLFRTFAKHYAKDGARVLVWKAPTLAMNPGLDPAVVEEAYEDDPESARAEYGAEFRDDISDFVSRDVVEACVEPGCRERPPALRAGRRYAAFVDAAGGSGTDAMTIAVAHVEDGVATLDALRERRPPFSPDDVTLEFAALMRSYGVAAAQSDRWGGDWVGEAFRKHRITMTPSAAPKSDIYREALPLLNARRVDLLDHPRLVSQLVGLERRTARGGRDSIDHGPGGHDDLANAAAGALLLAAGPAKGFTVPKDALAASRGAPGVAPARPGVAPEGGGLSAPNEFVGLARAFRAGLVAGHVAAVDAMGAIAAPMHRRSLLGQTASPAALARAAEAWRALPGAGRLSVKIHRSRVALAIDELRAAPASFSFESWGEGADPETVLMLLRATLRALPDGTFLFDCAPVASVPLHALARRLQRGWSTGGAALRADLKALARHDPPAAGSPFAQALPDGSWAGVAADVPRGAGSDRVLIVRTFLSAGMDARAPEVAGAA